MNDRPEARFFPGPPLKATYEHEYDVIGVTDDTLTVIELPAKLPVGKVRVRIEIERVGP